MTSADTPPDVRGPRFLERLPYASASETANPRWIVRMLSFLMLAHAVARGSEIILDPTAPGWLAGMLPWRLPCLVSFSLAAVFLLKMRRGAFVAVIVAYSWQVLSLLMRPIMMVVHNFPMVTVWNIAHFRRMLFMSNGAAVLPGILEAAAIIAIIARCRRAGALD